MAKKEVEKKGKDEQKFAAAAAAAAAADVILEAMVDAVGVCDLNGNIIQANTAYAKLFGYSKVDEVIGIHWPEYIPEEEYEKAMEAFQKSISEGVLRNIESVILTKDKKRTPVQLNITSLKDASGNPAGIIAVLRDIAEIKKVREDLQKRIGELEEFSKIAVERELDMKRLEEELEKLRGKK